MTKNLLLYIMGYNLVLIIQSCGLPDPTFKTEKDESFEINEENTVPEEIIELQNYIDSLEGENVAKAFFSTLVSDKKAEIKSRVSQNSSSSKIEITSSSLTDASSSSLAQSSSSSVHSSSSSSSSLANDVNLVDIANEEFIMAPGNYRVIFTNHSVSDIWRSLFCKTSVEDVFSMSYNGVDYKGWYLQITLSDDQSDMADFKIIDTAVTCYSLASSRSKSTVLKETIN